MTINSLISLVNDFHVHMGIERRSKLLSIEHSTIFANAQSLIEHSKQSLEIFRHAGDVRMLRMHLLQEELGEFMLALNQGDKPQILDGLCDLLYVLVGTAAVFGIPLEEGFAEVHRSNMTKRPSDQRASDKTGYEPAQLENIPWKE